MSYPYNYTVGERYEIDNNPASPFYEPPCDETAIPAEGRAIITAGMMHEADGDSPRGRCLVPVNQRATSQYLKLGSGDQQQPYTSSGGWYLEPDGASPRGAVLRARAPIGCTMQPPGPDEPQPPGIVATDFPADFGLVDGDQRLAETARLRPYLLDDGDSGRGQVLRFQGRGGCPNLAYGPDPDGDPGDPSVWSYADQDDVSQGLYHFDVFGRKCVSCPILFTTFDPPCLGCSFRTEDIGYGFIGGVWPINQCGDPYSSTVTDWCAQGGHAPLDLGAAHCVPEYQRSDPRYDPDWGTHCILDDDGNPADHHCEKCVYERNLGRMINEILRKSDCLSKLPMKPVYNTSSRHDCEYGCGEFGWTLWSSHGLDYLRIYGVAGSTANGWLAPGGNPFDNVARYEGPCGDAFNDCLDYASGWKGSGFPMCSRAIDTLCDNIGPDVWCQDTHFFLWLKSDVRNRVKRAHLCFSQWEYCDPADAPCSSNPIQELGGYHAPSSDLMVWVKASVEIQLVFSHWGPANRGACCYALFGGEGEPEEITVTVKGEFCGPMPWGQAAAAEWYGYEPVGSERIANYPGTFYDPQNVDGADNRGACSSMFVDQGTYGDFLAGNPAIGLFDAQGEPPKRCPNRLAGPKFWCPPSMDWSWSWSRPGGASSGDWAPVNPEANEADRPNHHHRANQCWSLQLAKNTGDGCADGTTHAGTDPVGCHAPDCRRGCSLTESVDAAGQRISPWRDPTQRYTPWGCGHCVDVYPADALASY